MSFNVEIFKNLFSSIIKYEKSITIPILVLGIFYLFQHHTKVLDRQTTAIENNTKAFASLEASNDVVIGVMKDLTHSIRDQEDTIDSLVIAMKVKAELNKVVNVATYKQKKFKVDTSAISTFDHGFKTAKGVKLQIVPNEPPPKKPARLPVNSVDVIADLRKKDDDVYVSVKRVLKVR